MATGFGVDWSAVRVVVFDVDGTLYAQAPLRRRVAAALLLHLLAHPGDAGLLRLIREFRRQREELAEEGAAGVARRQYERPASRLGLPPSRVQAAIEEWMMRRPLPYLRRCRFPRVERLFAELRSRGKSIGVFSDYPAAAKLGALGLEADLVVSGVDPEVDRLKPDPAGLARLLDRAGAEPREGLMIGDRDDRDGECARRLGVPCLLKGAGGGPGRFRDYGELLADLATAGPGRVP